MILDCTLRDGGFVNDWEFGHSSIRSIVSRLDSAGIEIIEVGFIDARREYDKHRSIFPDTESIGKTLSGMTVKQAMLIGMIDFGTCPIENISHCDASIIDGIRVIFKKKDVDAGLEFCAQLKRKGYSVFVNPVSLTSYTDKEILALLERINQLMPFGISIVDTYGLMLREEILHYMSLVDNNLAPGIKLAYHSHNNLQMAYANCCTLMDRRNQHDIIIDTSLYGMGKSAGNANTELVVSYANKVHGKDYKTEQLLDCIYTDILMTFRKSPWGYNLHYYLSALNDCHPDYLKSLLTKNTLSIQGINEIISKIPVERKLEYSHELIEKLYIEYQVNSINDTETYSILSDILNKQSILLIFPGRTIYTHRADIMTHIEEVHPIIISVNFLSLDFSPDYIFTGNRKRYDRLSDYYFSSIKKPEIIATSNILESNVPISHRLNYETLIKDEDEKIDYSSVLILNFLKRLGIKQVAIAGMDGFSPNSDRNYADPFMSSHDSAEGMQANNREVNAFINTIRKDMRIDFITPSVFKL